MTTPFGRKVREMRHQSGTTLKDLADALGVSQAYLSALETGRRPRPTPARVDQICAYFGIIWDEAEALKDLARLSQPRITIDTTGLSPDATELANRLSQRIRRLDAKTVRRLLDILE
ncbi:MAG TPA: transcriptional regulator [Rhodospirillaceae bacterium]|jgi:transcriptional regulator with XRE-family HTH domain|nr:transcriptional regulator [Rhodospirillaceae bacterium]MAL77433.1 transcriptional regulator [Rhodospirillaceae bacterium]MAX63656.1 transcriptional regulator [Rhodospirillaceae bacterium]MBB56646.1 transcriptional regulator [Rhodospirillaceae bacterium]HAD99945.1 transcriptional regulator [Rhodospirillaceae bacterium]|tara:strand:- start:200 stop:550 length:351 start_codon:yes stop_codon:yes gene_type:complete